MATSKALSEQSKKSGITPEQVRSALDKVIENGAIKSDRHKRFLSYIIEESLAGRGDHIKAYTIATEVLDRGDDFDASSDPIVRVEAGRLRRALEHYYLTAGINDLLKITIPKGGYLPNFDTHIGDKSQDSIRPEITPLTPPSHSEPALLVMPFDYQGNGDTYEYFADGLCEEIVIALSHHKELRIISGDTSNIVQDDKRDLIHICQKLHTRFALTGTVRVNDSVLRVSFQLHDATSGAQVMGRSYEYPNNQRNLFVIQDDITRQVVLNTADIYDGAIPRTITSEWQQVHNAPSSYDALLRFHFYNSCFSAEAYHEAMKAVEVAIENDKNNARIWAALAELTGDGYAHGLTDIERDTAISKAFKAARHAISLDRTHDYAYWTLAVTAIEAGDKDTAISAAESLLKLNPPPSTCALAGWCLALAGQWERGLEILNENMKVLQLYPGWLHHAPFLNYYRQGKYQDALNEAMKMNVPVLVWDPVERAAALGQLGKTELAKAAVQEITSLYPDFTSNPRRYLDCFVMQDELVDHLIEGLIKAGCPISS